MQMKYHPTAKFKLYYSPCFSSHDSLSTPVRSLAPVPSLALTSSSITASSCPQAGRNTDHNHAWNCQFRPTMPLKCISFTVGVTAQQLISHLGHPNVKICCFTTSGFLHLAVSADVEPQAVLPSLSIIFKLCPAQPGWDNSCSSCGLTPVSI